MSNSTEKIRKDWDKLYESILKKKCGGKAKKTKKAELGEELYPVHPLNKKCNCKPTLRREGGKLVTINSCTGLPWKKEGGSLVPKYYDGTGADGVLLSETLLNNNGVLTSGVNGVKYQDKVYSFNPGLFGLWRHYTELDANGNPVKGSFIASNTPEYRRKQGGLLSYSQYLK